MTRSACYFALRVLLDPDVPANAGAYAPVRVLAPEGSLVDARSPSAVVAGNVETSQRLADTVLLALAQAVDDLPAQGQGTMNNLVIGGEGWTYYETIGGGQGASPEDDGDSGVHVGMTNTLNTPVEALELEFPMRVERYELAGGSGGDGRAPRRGRDRPCDPRARAGDRLAADRSPRARPAGRRRGVGGRHGREPHRRRARPGQDGAGARRRQRRHRRDPRRGRLGRQRSLIATSRPVADARLPSVIRT